VLVLSLALASRSLSGAQRLSILGHLDISGQGQMIFENAS